MTNFENDSTPFQKALESSGTHNPRFLADAMQLHNSSDLKGMEERVAESYPDHKYENMRVHLALLAAANSDVAKADPTLQSSIYRDIALQEQGIALAKLKTWDIEGANILLNGWNESGPSSKNLISKAETLDPNNKDLEQLHQIQDDLTELVDGIKNIRPAVQHFGPAGLLNTDYMEKLSF